MEERALPVIPEDEMVSNSGIFLYAVNRCQPSFSTCRCCSIIMLVYNTESQLCITCLL